MGFVGHLAQTNDFSFDNMKRALMEAATMGSIAVEAFGPERIFEVTHEEVRARRALFTDLAQVT